MALSMRASIYHLTVVVLTPRPINAADEKITDYDFGSLIRTDAMKEYSKMNTTFGPFLISHLHFYAAYTSYMQLRKYR